MRVDFYIIPEKNDLISFTCQLVEKIYQQKKSLFIYANNESQAHEIDECLWTIKASSFIPHHIVGEGPNTPAPIQIGYADKNPQRFDCLINLSDTIPDFNQRFSKIIEFVPSDPALKQLARERYAQYKTNGALIQTHQPNG